MNEPSMTNPQCVRDFKCETWEDFIANVRTMKGKTLGDRIYRGHASLDWKLSSMFERWLLKRKGENPNRNVRELFSKPEGLDLIRESYRERFKDIAIGLPGLPSGTLDEADWWAIGRHHGLITPILDWTKSPYIAAFFACVDYADQHTPGFKQGLTEGGIVWGGDSVAVWALVITDGLEVKDEFEILRPDIGYSQYSTWMRSQQSVFTRLTHDVHVDVESYLFSRGLGDHLERYEIPGKELLKALADLKRMNINFASLFPDMSGAAKQANIWSTLETL